MADNKDEDIITLEYDDGVKEETEALGVFEVEGKDYIALKPIAKNDGDVYIFSYKDISDDEYEIDEIEDEEEFKKVAEAFDTLINE